MKPYMKTMIPHEHDHGVVSESRLLDGTQHSSHLVIHEADGGVVSSPQFSLLEKQDQTWSIEAIVKSQLVKMVKST